MKHIKFTSHETTSFPIGIIVSQFNREITQALQEGCLQRLKELGVRGDHITLIEVPGAIEIPLIVKLLAEKGRYGALIALGAVIRGETTHYDYVCQQVSVGCQQVSSTFNLPVIFGVLTTENEAQAWDRIGGAHGHKGKDAADCAMAMHNIIQQL